MKVFLDVGAHVGSTLMAVRDPKYAFDRIYCFEPASSCWPALKKRADRRVTICHFGLWNRTTKQTLYDPGSSGASLYADKFREGTTGEKIRLVRASEWFSNNVRAEDEVYLKLNCEGAEVEILEDLLDTGCLAQVRSVMIDPDVRKVPSQAHRESELRERLALSGLTNYALEEDVMVGRTHRERIQHWLRGAGAERRSPTIWLRQASFVVFEALRGHREPLRAALTP